ncbi:DUF2069 domain-containing protein [Corallincola holothuriorum]|uniref:DUF2069 domain-containing protein n=1 Tax=Corallincola holothuriorum TaxID=2282215 RepID=A0A368NKD5_9GAMM|nr:DUF2069 domain-containing protein [Corallincola holothuriorum]RCU50333.1 DUF2069 domain-containing protein [Corallincola holothuriorum]
MSKIETTTRRFQQLALSCYLGLVLWVPLWHFVLAPHPEMSVGFILFIGCLPLLLPLPGLLTGKPYTYAWANFIIVCYLGHGLTAIYSNPGEAWWALIEIILSTGAFIGCVYFARHRGRELGLGLKKLKQPK